MEDGCSDVPVARKSKISETMLTHVLIRYLSDHKRIVVPQLGAFIVREPGREILFSELLRRDDGVLRALLTEASGSELAAAGEIDRFLFEVRHALEHGRSYPLEGLGRFEAGPGGAVTFRYEPGPAAPLPTCGPVAKAPADARMQPGRLAEAVKGAFDRPAADPAVRGLRYGKPQRDPAARARRRGDLFIWIAVAVAVVALAAIAFGYYSDRKEAELSSMELAIPAADPVSDDQNPIEP